MHFAWVNSLKILVNFSSWKWHPRSNVYLILNAMIWDYAFCIMHYALCTIIAYCLLQEFIYYKYWLQYYINVPSKMTPQFVWILIAWVMHYGLCIIDYAIEQMHNAQMIALQTLIGLFSKKRRTTLQNVYLLF